VAAALYGVPDLRKKKAHTADGQVAHEAPKVMPADPEVVEQTLPHLLAIVADMVRLQQLTGARPGEVCALRGCDLERGWKVVGGVEVWLYRLDEHKTDWRGHHRWVPIGPRAQALLSPYLAGRPPEAYVFSPHEAREAWLVTRRKPKAVPKWQEMGWRSPGRKKKPGPKKAAPKNSRRPGERYTTNAYDHAVRRACLAAGVKAWAPNQLRHRMLTDVEVNYDRDNARCVGGHKNASTTSTYTESVEKAANVIAKMG
jgi:integrase